MARPSRNIDRVLMAAGRDLLPETGCRNLSVRQVVERAGVNLGMFHYHFKSRDNFVRAVLQEMYEEMFASLQLERARHDYPLPGLRAVLRILGRFARDHRRLLMRVMSDAFAGDPIAGAFVRDNAPRHLAVVAALIARGQRDGELRHVPVPQAIAFVAAGVAMPIIAGAAVEGGGLAPAVSAKDLSQQLLSNKAIDQRVDMALAGLAAPKRAPRAPKKENRC